jgi:hypothetical protein
VGAGYEGVRLRVGIEETDIDEARGYHKNSSSIGGHVVKTKEYRWGCWQLIPKLD